MVAKHCFINKCKKAHVQMEQWTRVLLITSLSLIVLSCFGYFYFILFFCTEAHFFVYLCKKAHFKLRWCLYQMTPSCGVSKNSERCSAMYSFAYGVKLFCLSVRGVAIMHYLINICFKWCCACYNFKCLITSFFFLLLLFYWML